MTCWSPELSVLDTASGAAVSMQPTYYKLTILLKFLLSTHLPNTLHSRRSRSTSNCLHSRNAQQRWHRNLAHRKHAENAQNSWCKPDSPIRRGDAQSLCTHGIKCTHSIASSRLVRNDFRLALRPVRIRYLGLGEAKRTFENAQAVKRVHRPDSRQLWPPNHGSANVSWTWSIDKGVAKSFLGRGYFGYELCKKVTWTNSRPRGDIKSRPTSSSMTLKWGGRATHWSNVSLTLLWMPCLR